MKYKQLSDQERELIFLGLAKGLSIRKIATEIKRDHTSVSRELLRNRDPGGNYSPFIAQEEASKRKSFTNSQNPKKDPRVMKYVKGKLELNWSPEQISGRLELLELPNVRVSPETIYRYIYSKENTPLGLWVYLRRARPRRSTWHGRKPQREFIPNRKFIDERPEYINNRLGFGHWETDLVLGTKATKDAISVTVERKARFTVLKKVKAATSIEKSRTTIDGLAGFPPWMRKSMTFDNGSENARHEQIAVSLNLTTFFCHAYSSWERGTVENTNGLIRQYFPKKTSLARVTQRDLTLVAGLLNDRPRKTLGYKTPYEVFYEELDGAVGLRI